MIVRMELSELQKQIFEYAAKETGASGGILTSDGFEFSDESQIKPFMDFLTWDYGTHTAYMRFIQGKLSKEKFDKVCEAISGINKAIRESK